MSKYEPLKHLLSQKGDQQIPMTFEEIEAILGFPLPPSSRTHRAWWSNNASNNVMTKAWLAAGFESEQVDIEKGCLVFRRVEMPVESAEKKPSRRHPLFGAMKGTFTIAEGVDLTEPADPEWADLAEKKAREWHF